MIPHVEPCRTAPAIDSKKNIKINNLSREFRYKSKPLNRKANPDSKSQCIQQPWPHLTHASSNCLGGAIRCGWPKLGKNILLPTPCPWLEEWNIFPPFVRDALGSKSLNFSLVPPLSLTTIIILWVPLSLTTFSAPCWGAGPSRRTELCSHLRPTHLLSPAYKH